MNDKLAGARAASVVGAQHGLPLGIHAQADIGSSNGRAFVDSMLIKSVLVHHPLAEVCYLREALMWVAFNCFPLADEVSDEIQDPTQQECARVGLPAKPIYSGTLPGFTPENLKELADFPSTAERRQSFEREIAITVEYQDSCKRWGQELYDLMDRHRTQLCVALRDGSSRKASGRQTAPMNKQNTSG